MTLRSKVASALSFAHLAGLASARASEDDDKDPKKDSAEGDDPEKKDDDDKTKSNKADDDKEKKTAEGDDPDKKDDDDSKSKGKKAKSEEDDDDNKKPAAEDDDDEDEDEMRGNSAAASARRRERARCAAIFASKAAGRNPALAANLAFNTSMTRQEALAVLENSPAAVTSIGDRSARNPDLGAGGEMGAPKQSAADRMADRMRAVQGR
jgi:hypothetical protein